MEGNFVTRPVPFWSSGLRAGEGPAPGAAADGVHVSDGDLLQGHPAAEGPGGGAGEEVQAGGDAGHRGRSQRREHDQRYQQGELVEPKNKVLA